MYNKFKDFLYTKWSENKDKTEELVSYQKLFSILPDHQIRELIYMMESSKDYNQSIYKKEHEKFFNVLYLEWFKLKDRKRQYPKMLKELEEDLSTIKELAKIFKI